MSRLCTSNLILKYGEVVVVMISNVVFEASHKTCFDGFSLGLNGLGLLRSRKFLVLELKRSVLQ